ncbi:MAG TPA: RNA polymerase sigma factor [Microlunatus sp.]|nr:RNA polymerase sigma factor [Microlunatus sp.]
MTESVPQVDDGQRTATVDPAPAGSPGSPRAQVPRLSETAWVNRAQDGDARAFEQLVRAYEGELFRLAYRMLADRGEAEDAVQETFVVVWRQLPTLVDPQAFRAWIYHIATRRCLNVLQRRSRQRTDVTRGDDFEAETKTKTSLQDRGEGPEAAAQATAVRQSLEQVLATLPPEQRACWVLNELHDLTYPEIAFAIGVPLSTVRGRIARARQNLAKGMAAWR